MSDVGLRIGTRRALTDRSSTTTRDCFAQTEAQFLVPNNLGTRDVLIEEVIGAAQLLPLEQGGAI
jgi:hypothetical protein